MDEKQNGNRKAGRPRGRPPGSKRFSRTKPSPQEVSSQIQANGATLRENSSESEEEASGLHDLSSLPASGSGSFATLLGYLIKNDRSEVLRIARAIGVSDNTVYRWLNGTAEPRHSHLTRLLEVLPWSSPLLS